MALHKSTDPGAGCCPIRDVLDRLGDRWSMLVLSTLAESGTLRFTILRSRVQDVSPRMLAQTLRRLEQDGLVSRTVHPTIPPRVDYALTPLGASFMQPLGDLVRWADRHHGEVRAARANYVAPSRQPAL